MTLEQYLEQNRPFYHITAENNMECIREKGIENRMDRVVGRRLGVCVTRSNDLDMWKYIAERYLLMDGKDFNVIELHPQNYALSPKSITADNADLPISNIHNYINRPSLHIFPDTRILDLEFPSPDESYHINQKFEKYEPQQLEGI